MNALEPADSRDVAESSPIRAWMTQLRQSPRALALIVTLTILATLGIGALADALATAPLRPATHGGATQQAGTYTLALTISPDPLAAGVGATFRVRVTDATGAATTDAQVRCNFTMPAMPMPLMQVAGQPQAAGVYACRTTLTATGAWALTVTLTPPGAPSVHTTFALQAS